MKKLLILAAVCLTTVGFAQSNKEDIDILQSLFGKEKKIIVGDFIKLEGAQKDAFWKLYDEYEVTRKEYGRTRIALLEKYAANYGTMSDEETSKLMKEMGSLGIKTDKLISTYYKKMEKSCGVKPAAQFFQLEVYLLSVVRASIFESIPLIGELD
jgi:hypothetical protein